MPTKEISEVPMIAIPAGEFTMGNDSGDGDETPAHKVSVDAFEIDKFEVTNEQFQDFVDQTGHVSTAEKAGESGTWHTYAQGKPNHPVVLVSWSDAVAYCEWAGKRLPTEAEWEKAARGPEEFIYPWGNEWATGKANTEESGYRGTTIVGSLPDGASPYGVMDMAGNVSEWTSDWYEAYPGTTFTSPYFGKKFRVIRGGGWFSSSDLVRTTERSGSVVDLHNDDVGFRCAR
jgi:formylglycine-generating enzyme required for sulfatase activity